MQIEAQHRAVAGCQSGSIRLGFAFGESESFGMPDQGLYARPAVLELLGNIPAHFYFAGDLYTQVFDFFLQSFYVPLGVVSLVGPQRVQCVFPEEGLMLPHHGNQRCFVVLADGGWGKNHKEIAAEAAQLIHPSKFYVFAHFALDDTGDI